MVSRSGGGVQAGAVSLSLPSSPRLSGSVRRSRNVGIMESLCEDLVLLAIDPARGVVRNWSRLNIALRGAELAQLQGAGRVEVSGGRIVVTGSAATTTGDPDLDATLARLASCPQPPRPRAFVGRHRANVVGSYLARLSGAGFVQRQGGRWFRQRWSVIDQSRLASARARLDTVAFGAGDDGSGQVVLAGLVQVIGIARSLYPGRPNRAVRVRLRQIGRSHWAVQAVRSAIAASESH